MLDKSFWKGKKVFLTGHTGFKGSWMAIWLNELGAKVCGFALEPNTNPSLYKLAELDGQITSIIGDIRDLTLLKQTMKEFSPDIVIHMAAQPLVSESYENPVETYSTNVMGTVNLFESVRHCETVRAVVNITTDKVYENKEWIWGYKEMDRLGGHDPYSNSKACAELVTSSYINSFFNKENSGLRCTAVATVRAGNVIGGGDWAINRLIPDIIRAIENKLPIELRNPRAVRPWQHVLEPLSGYLLLAEKLYTYGLKWNGAWNFGPAQKDVKTVEEIVQIIMNELQIGYECKVDENANFHETQQLNLDSTKATRVLNWQQKWAVEETLKKIIQWQKRYKNEEAVYLICKSQIAEYEGF